MKTQKLFFIGLIALIFQAPLKAIQPDAAGTGSKGCKYTSPTNSNVSYCAYCEHHQISNCTGPIAPAGSSTMPVKKINTITPVIKK